MVTILGHQVNRRIAMLNTIALFASARRHGNTGRLIDRIASELKIETVDLSGLRISPFDYDHRNRDDDFEPVMRRVLAHDQIIFASPIYWYAVSAPMKVFLDRISDFLELPDLLAEGRRLRGKTGYVICTSASEAAAPEFMSAFDEVFRYLGMRLGGALHVNCSDGYASAEHDPIARDFALRVREAGLAEARA
jgi:multimeric flavodoxin WrbA